MDRFREREFYASPNIDYDEVARRIDALRPCVADLYDVRTFFVMLQPVANAIIEDYRHLLRGAAYHEGEFKTLLVHIQDCVNALIPPQFSVIACGYDSQGRMIIADTTRIVKTSGRPS